MFISHRSVYLANKEILKLAFRKLKDILFLNRTINSISNGFLDKVVKTIGYILFTFI